MPDLDLDAIRARYAQYVATADDAKEYALAGVLCASVPLLVDEVKRLRGLLRDVDLYGQAFVYSPAGKEPLVLHPADVTVHMRADAVTAHEAALKVVHAAEAWREARARIRDDNVAVPTWVLAREINDAGDGLADAVDEWRRRGE